MHNTLQFKIQPLLPEPFLSFNSNNGKCLSSRSCSFSATKPHLLFRSSSLSLLKQHSDIQTQSSTVCARNNRRRSRSRRFRRLVFELVNFIAPNLNVLPGALEFVLAEFGGGNGGGLGFLKGFGGGGFGGWRRNRKGMFGLFWVLMGFALGLWLIWGKNLENDLLWWVLGFSALGLSINGWRRGFREWVLGFCCAGLLGLGLQREDLQKWVKGFRFMDIVRRRKRRRRM